MFGKKKPNDPSAEWTKTGSFVHKPQRGWLHSDNSLKEGGVCYAVKVSWCYDRYFETKIIFIQINSVSPFTFDFKVFLFLPCKSVTNQSLIIFKSRQLWFAAIKIPHKRDLTRISVSIDEDSELIFFLSLFTVCWLFTSSKVHANSPLWSSTTSYKVKF